MNRVMKNTTYYAIDPDTYNVTASHQRSASAFATFAGLQRETKDWNMARLIELWNSFAGVAPFGDLKPVKKFTSRDIAINRIWAALQRLEAATAAEPEQDAPKATKPAKKAKPAEAAKAPKPANDPEPKKAGGKKAEVLALMARPQGAALSEIASLTGWQNHTTRSFISVTARKLGLLLTTEKRDGERIYKTS